MDAVTQADDYRSLYQSYLELCNAHDFDGMASFYTPTITVNGAPMDPSTVTAQFAPIISGFPDWHWEVRHIVVDADTIVVHFTVTGTHQGTFAGIEASGRQVSVQEFTLYRIVDGKFDEVWDLLDMDAAIRQIADAE
jgi:steroid delta-isomerase-like uncharacterized protein